ncbi:MAG: 3-dehydroquinate synthase [Lentisphaerae bacterium]|nr:3-dehydroquinate synthase [Lentisphaerota bacterium]
MERYDQAFTVGFRYPVCFTHGVFDPDNPLLADVVRECEEQPRRTVVFVDDGVASARPNLVSDIENYLRAKPAQFELVQKPVLVPGGERAKNGWELVRDIMAATGEAHLCRHSFVIAVGGGSVLDLVGLAASLVHRGVRLIRVPTTVVSQCDGGVGVKTGMDGQGMKNFVGTFAPPFAVLVDYGFLDTLDTRYWIGGVAEAFKVAIIKDAEFFRHLETNARRLAVRDQGAIEHVVHRAAVLHLDHIRTGGDPFESGSARPLDFGHWAAHKLEIMSDYAMGHGQAVAIGIALDSFYAEREGHIDAAERTRILDAMREAGLPRWTPLLERRTDSGSLEILEGLEEFREHLGGELTVTLPDGIGGKIEVHKMDPSIVEEGVRFLRGHEHDLAAGSGEGSDRP